MSFPNLTPTDKGAAPTQGVMLAVYAPFGDDPVLSTFPEGSTCELAQHPLMSGLLKVASHGIHVAALIDLVGDETYLVDIPAGLPAELKVSCRWKQDMTSPFTLAGLLAHAARREPAAALVLALEGHGAGFMPDIDAHLLTTDNVTAGGKYEWRVSGGNTNIFLAGTNTPAVTQGAPILPAKSPTLPMNVGILSTWGLGQALKLSQASGARKVSVIHFNNCFNLSVELLHTVAPYAEFATAYANYNFFTAGATYPKVFEALEGAGSATAEQLAIWFADANRAFLAAKGNHPTIGGVVPLARMKLISERIDDLADALVAALRSALPAARPTVINNIRAAIIKSQQFDSVPGQQLEAPDELTDIYSFATELLAFNFAPHKVESAAIALQKALDGIKRYGEKDRPWTDLNVVWDFSAKTLAMNIFLPDPRLIGLWDWRSPYYLDVNPVASQPPVQPNLIDFVKVTDWVDFIIEYHKGVAFKGLRPAAIPTYPVFNATFDPKKPGPTTPGTPGTPGGTNPSDPGTNPNNPGTNPGTTPGTTPGTIPGTTPGLPGTTGRS